MNQDYWVKFYQDKEKLADIEKPSDFAYFCFSKIRHNTKLLDIGAGNGRDSKLFSGKSFVTSVDYAYGEKVSLEEFMATNDVKFDYVYSRFFLHTISEELEQKFFDWLPTITKAYLFLETRSVNDSGFNNDHNRRLIDGNLLLVNIIKRHFRIKYFKEGKNMAIFQNFNPTVIRLIAKK